MQYSGFFRRVSTRYAKILLYGTQTSFFTLKRANFHQETQQGWHTRSLIMNIFTWTWQPTWDYLVDVEFPVHSQGELDAVFRGREVGEIGAHWINNNRFLYHYLDWLYNLVFSIYNSHVHMYYYRTEIKVNQILANRFISYNVYGRNTEQIPGLAFSNDCRDIHLRCYKLD